MPAHGESCRAEWHAVVVDVGRSAGGGRVIALTGMEGNDGCDGFGLEKMVDPMRIEATIIDGGPDGDGQGVGRTGFEEAVETQGTHGAVRAMARFQQEMYRQGMFRGDHAVLKVAMAEKVGVPIRIVAPGRRRVGVEALVIASKDALGSAVTGGAPMGTGPRREGGAVPAEDERLEIAQKPVLDRGEDSTEEEEVFQAGQQLLGAGLP